LSEPLVVIGNGMAAARFVEELDLRARGRYAIAVIGAEPALAYNRVLLSSVLAGETAADEIELKPAPWWRTRGVTLVYGKAAARIDLRSRAVMLEDGRFIPFSKLLLATGSRAVRLPLPGMDLPGVLTFRDLGDVAAMTRLAARGQHAVVIGGGLLGLEAAYGLARHGARVTVLHLMDRLMERQLDPRAAALLKQAVEAKGIEVILNAETTALEGEAHVRSVLLKDGRRLDADLVIAALGVRANAELASGAGIEVGRGIVVDDGLETSASGVFEIGECAEHRGVGYGLVEPAYEQARVLAVRLTGGGALYSGSVLATNLKVSGVSVFSAGEFLGGGGADEIVLSDPGIALYKKLVIRDGRLTGAVLFGDTSDALWYLELIRTGETIEPFRDDLAFGRALALRKAA
jgi:nitrite reductase (NADH) large subunit